MRSGIRDENKFSDYNKLTEDTAMNLRRKKKFASLSGQYNMQIGMLVGSSDRFKRTLYLKKTYSSKTEVDFLKRFICSLYSILHL